MERRQYQVDCALALWDSIQEPGCSPVVAVPTGAGKTHIMSIFIKRYLWDRPDDRIVVLSHTHNILEQDFEALSEYLPEHTIGIFSAGLGEKDIQQITVAGIQSIANAPELVKWTNLWIVDEVHSVNHKAIGNYRKILDTSPGIKTGMSATVFRSGHGYIYKGKTALFNKLAYDLTSKTDFNRLIDNGYLCDLIPIETGLQLDSKNVKKSAGDYNVKHLAEAHDKNTITEAAVKETIHYGKKYKKWLVFAIDIEHADHIHKCLIKHGIKAGILHSRMNGDRKAITQRFKTGDLQALVSVGMVTTGFDAPNIDMIVLLRPTMSAVLHVQMIGRGLRVYPDKKHCLVLDFAGNTMRLGPINDVRVPKKAGKGLGNGPIMKTCPECQTMVPPAVRECPSCGHAFEFKIRLTTHADSSDIIDRGKPKEAKWLNVQSVTYKRHQKLGRPDSVRVTYHCGITSITEYVCPEHPGFAGTKARHWLQYRKYGGSMSTIGVLAKCEYLKEPTKILVNFNEKYPEITNSQFGD